MGRFQPDSFTQYLDPVLTGDGGLLGPPGQYPPAQNLDGAALHPRVAGDRPAHAVARSRDAWRLIRDLMPIAQTVQKRAPVTIHTAATYQVSSHRSVVSPAVG